MVSSTAPARTRGRDLTDELRRIATRFIHKRFCFVAGTHVTTIRGDIPVEEIKTGDLVRAKSGAYVPVKWVAIYEVAVEDVVSRPDLMPALLRRGAIGDGLPRRDLYVTGGQLFDAAIRIKINHHLRMSAGTLPPPRSGADRNFVTYVMFECFGARAVRAERLWVTSTPCIDHFEEPKRPSRPLMAGYEKGGNAHG